MHGAEYERMPPPSFETVGATYSGETGANYDRERRGAKWNAEVNALEELFRHVPQGARTLYAPVGTARFFGLFDAHKLQVHGIDMSQDMLTQAQAAAGAVGGALALQQADLRQIPYPDDFFDLVVCIRFLNLVDRESASIVLRELTRVSGDKLLIGIRYIAPAGELSGMAGLVRHALRPIWVLRRLYRRSAVLIQTKAFVTDA